MLEYTICVLVNLLYDAFKLSPFLISPLGDYSHFLMKKSRPMSIGDTLIDNIYLYNKPVLVTWFVGLIVGDNLLLRDVGHYGTTLYGMCCYNHCNSNAVL
jgi:hypothetical protein